MESLGDGPVGRMARPHGEAAQCESAEGRDRLGAGVQSGGRGDVSSMHSIARQRPARRPAYATVRSPPISSLRALGNTWWRQAVRSCSSSSRERCRRQESGAVPTRARHCARYNESVCPWRAEHARHCVRPAGGGHRCGRGADCVTSNTSALSPARLRLRLCRVSAYCSVVRLPWAVVVWRDQYHSRKS